MPSTDTKINEIFIPGPAGRLEAKYFKSKKNTAPIALVLHPHPQYGGTMNNKVVVDTFQTFVDNYFSVCGGDKVHNIFVIGGVWRWWCCRCDDYFFDCFPPTWAEKNCPNLYLVFSIHSSSYAFIFDWIGCATFDRR